MCEFLTYKKEYLYSEDGKTVVKIIDIPNCLVEENTEFKPDLPLECPYKAKICEYKMLLEEEALYEGLSKAGAFGDMSIKEITKV